MIDEIHWEDSAAMSVSCTREILAAVTIFLQCLVRTLNAMPQHTEIDSNIPSVPRRRVDKCLIMTGTNSEMLEKEIRT